MLTAWYMYWSRMHYVICSKVFAVFCGLAMHSVMNYEKILKAHARQKVALEVLSFHASAPIEEAERVMVRYLLGVPFCPGR